MAHPGAILWQPCPRESPGLGSGETMRSWLCVGQQSGWWACALPTESPAKRQFTQEHVLSRGLKREGLPKPATWFHSAFNSLW